MNNWLVRLGLLAVLLGLLSGLVVEVAFDGPGAGTFLVVVIVVMILGALATPARKRGQ